MQLMIAHFCLETTRDRGSHGQSACLPDPVAADMLGGTRHTTITSKHLTLV